MEWDMRCFVIQFFPSMIRAIIMLETLSPMELTIVAGGSTRVPIMEMIGRASIGKPYRVTIINSPISPPRRNAADDDARKQCDAYDL